MQALSSPPATAPELAEDKLDWLYAGTQSVKPGNDLAHVTYNRYTRPVSVAASPGLVGNELVEEEELPAVLEALPGLLACTGGRSGFHHDSSEGQRRGGDVPEGEACPARRCRRPELRH